MGTLNDPCYLPSLVSYHSLKLTKNSKKKCHIMTTSYFRNSLESGVGLCAEWASVHSGPLCIVGVLGTLPMS